ncbi:hypothetical protein AB0E77_00205 [Streptomyces sp. NPDC032940]
MQYHSLFRSLTQLLRFFHRRFLLARLSSEEHFVSFCLICLPATAALNQQ